MNVRTAMIAVARIGRGIGLKGEVSVTVLGDRPDRLSGLTHVEVGPEDGPTERRTIESVDVRNGRTVVKFAEVGTREGAEALTGSWIFVADEDGARPDRGSYLVHELMGCTVVSEEGRTIGTLSDVMTLPSGDLWVVRSGDRETLIPAVKEFVRKVDLASRTIVIHVIDGLVE